MKRLEEAHYYHTIEDFNGLLEQYGAKQVLEDLRILSLTNYEDLARIVMSVDRTQKAVARVLKDPYFKNVGED